MIEAQRVRLFIDVEKWFENMKEAGMSIEKPNEIRVVFESRWRVVMYDHRAMHSYGDIVIANKRPRDVFQGDVVRSETCCSQRAQSSTQVGAQRLVFGHVELRTELINPLVRYAPGLPKQLNRSLTDIGIISRR